MEWNFKVEGMMCPHCKQKVENKLKEICPKAKIKINLESKEVNLSCNCKEIKKDLIKEEIKKLNFKVVE